MERLVFARVPVWIVLLLFVVGLLTAVGFGHVLRQEIKSPGRFGALGQTAIDIAKVPTTIEDLIRNKDRMAAERTDRHDGKKGWQITQPITDPNEGYLLLARYSGDLRQAEIDLVDLTDMSVKYTWLPDADILLSGAVIPSAISDTDRWNKAMFRPAHPILLPDGNLILKDHESPLMRVDGCARLVWREETDIYHHASSLGPDGTIWVPTRIEPSTITSSDQFNDDALAEVSLDGRLLQSLSLTRIFLDNGLRPLLFAAGSYRSDSFHLNDIEPVMEDGPYWKKGDLFVSMRHLSMIMLYRPSTGKIIWRQQGPWMAQHDVDIIDDHTISIFDNRAYDIGKGWYVDGTNDVTLYDFRTGITASPLAEGMKAADIVTLTEGLADWTPGGRTMVEENNSGRIVIFAPDGTIAEEYVNRAADGKVYRMGWSRLVPRDLGDKALDALAGQNCDG